MGGKKFKENQTGLQQQIGDIRTAFHKGKDGSSKTNTMSFMPHFIRQK